MKYLIQQREVLSEMGIDWWVSSSSPTTNLSDIKLVAVVPSGLIHDNDVSQPDTKEIIDTVNLGSNPCTSDIQSENISSQTLKIPDVTQLDYPSQVPQKTSMIETSFLVDEVSEVKQPEINTPTNKTDTIQPFRLQALHFSNWILLVDEVFLRLDEHKNQQALWLNICQALDKPTETLTFPLVNDVQMVAMSATPMNTLELAKATLSGFVFGMVKSKEIKLAGLTKLPEGLDDLRFMSIPMLEDMIENPMLKQDLWTFLHDY